MSGMRNSDLFEVLISKDLIFQLLQGYLNTTFDGTNNLLNASRRFQLMKKAKFYWKLNKEYSLKFFRTNGHRFKSKLNSLHTDSKSQLSLKFPRFMKTTDVSQLQDMHAIDFGGSRKISGVSALQNVHSLNLKSCIGVPDNPNHIVEIGGVRQIYQVPIDITTLGNVYQLNLSFCDGVKDVSALGNVYELLRKCRRCRSFRQGAQIKPKKLFLHPRC